MNLLLDTNIVILFANGDETLPIKKRDIISNSENQNYCSLISIWEIAIKTNIGKLKFDLTLETLEVILIENNIKIISPTIADLATYQNLPLHHKDPFDRLIIAQAITNKLAIITKDDFFSNYEVDIIW
jgi:PIN domain nuclease of toxin-antitoxin system